MKSRLIAFTAASASALVLAFGAAGTAHAGGTNGPLCTVIGTNTYLYSIPDLNYPAAFANYGETFRRHEAHGGGWSMGHSASSFPTDYWVRSSQISC